MEATNCQLKCLKSYWLLGDRLGSRARNYSGVAIADGDAAVADTGCEEQANCAIVRMQSSAISGAISWKGFVVVRWGATRGLRP